MNVKKESLIAFSYNIYPSHSTHVESLIVRQKTCTVLQIITRTEQCDFCTFNRFTSKEIQFYLDI